MSDRRLVLIIWKDAQCIQATGRWVDASDVDNCEPATVKCVGWIRKQTPDFITIYSHDGDDVLGGDLCIPAVCVTSIVDLEPKK
jgi:hypothetical protein